MPNWCNNNIKIEGPKDKIKDIWDRVQADEDKGFFQHFVPMPKELEGTTSPSSSAKKPQPMIEGFDCWYDLICHNWSTKWEVCEFYGVDRQYHSEQNEGESTISFGFSSAWAPPIGAYEKFLENNSDCSVRAFYYCLLYTSDAADE